MIALSAFIAPALLRPQPRMAASVQAMVPSQPSLYAPFVDRALELFEDSGLVLEPYPLLDEGLMRCEGSSGSGAKQQPVELSVRAYETKNRIRQTRLALIEGGSALQVLNFCIFPSLSYGLPSFAADLVTLPGGHLIALDWAPNGDTLSDPIYARTGALAAAYERHRPLLPDGGAVPDAAAKFVSPYFLWSRLPSGDASEEVLSTRVLAAFEDYLRAYLQLAATASPLDAADSCARSSVREAQLAYQVYRAESDPARPMLTRLFGTEYAERLIREVLFDLPLREQATGSS
jgi:phycoerythrobilin:ferredoxin oxidoreductase